MTIFFEPDVYFEVHKRSKLFVIIRVGKEKVPPVPKSRVHHGRWSLYHKHVIARGRMVDDKTLRVTRSEVSLKQIRDWFKKASYNVKVVGAKRR